MVVSPLEQLISELITQPSLKSTKVTVGSSQSPRRPFTSLRTMDPQSELWRNTAVYCRIFLVHGLLLQLESTAEDLTDLVRNCPWNTFGVETLEEEIGRLEATLQTCRVAAQNVLTNAGRTLHTGDVQVPALGLERQGMQATAPMSGPNFPGPANGPSGSRKRPGPGPELPEPAEAMEAETQEMPETMAILIHCLQLCQMEHIEGSWAAM